jgi:hypothetical protein
LIRLKGVLVSVFLYDWIGASSAKNSEEGNLDLSRVHKKIAEAHYFLRLLTEQEPRIAGDKDPFDFLLSAFHSAGRTVDYRLRHEHGAAYVPWRKAWDARLTTDETSLIKFMIDAQTHPHPIPAGS